MRSLLVLAVCIVTASAMYDSWESIPVDETKESTPDIDFEQESVQTLVQEAKHLSQVSSPHAGMSLHADRIAKHAKLLQSVSSKAKAYAHNFNNSKNAIRSALKALTGQLNAGHRHDTNALRSERNRGNAAINGAHNSGKNKVSGFRNKACPTKRLEQEARAKRDAALKAANGLGNGKICSGGLGTTYGDMDVEKAVPKFGTELRNKWDKARARYQSSLGKYRAAKKAHSAALKKYNVAMAQFKTALSIEVSNARRACKNAHSEYEALKREVASNVKSRKNVFISTLIITCYVDNITNNHSAKVCADKKRRISTSQWNINGHSLNRCQTKAHLTNTFGPSNWTPSSRSCHIKHCHHAAHVKEVNRKELATKEKKQKEKNKKQREREHKHRVAMEQNQKEAAAKHRQRLERTDKQKIERRQKNTCQVFSYEHNNYSGTLIYHHRSCTSGRHDVRFPTWGRRRGYQASSFRLSSGCRQVQLWDYDQHCRYGGSGNQNIHHSVPSVSYDLNDDICGISIWSKCRL